MQPIIAQKTAVATANIGTKLRLERIKCEPCSPSQIPQHNNTKALREKAAKSLVEKVTTFSLGWMVQLAKSVNMLKTIRLFRFMGTLRFGVWTCPKIQYKNYRHHNKVVLMCKNRHISRSFFIFSILRQAPSMRIFPDKSTHCGYLMISINAWESAWIQKPYDHPGKPNRR